MFGRHWHTIWIIAIMLAVVLIAGLLVVFQMRIIDWSLWFAEFEG